jgi:hypothetical protein
LEVGVKGTWGVGTVMLFGEEFFFNFGKFIAFFLRKRVPIPRKIVITETIIQILIILAVRGGISVPRIICTGSFEGRVKSAEIVFD